MKDSASGIFPLILLCDKLDTLHGQAVNALHQRFSRNVIFTASTLDLKHMPYPDGMYSTDIATLQMLRYTPALDAYYSPCYTRHIK